MPPPPPTTGLTAAITVFWLRSSRVITLTMQLLPAGAAGIRSGIACAKAPKITERSRAQVSERMPTAAGATGFSTVPSGAMQVKGRVSPVFSRMRGLSV